MAGSGVEIHGLVAVVLGALVLVHDHEANGSAQSNAKLGTGLDLHAILLVSRSRDGGLTWPSSGHLGLNVGLCELHAGRTAINDAADGAAVGFTIAAYKEAMSVCDTGRLVCSEQIFWRGNFGGLRIRGDPEVVAECGHDWSAKQKKECSCCVEFVCTRPRKENWNVEVLLFPSVDSV